MPVVNPEGLCSPQNPWGGGTALTAGGAGGAAVSNVSPSQRLLSFVPFEIN